MNEPHEPHQQPTQGPDQPPPWSYPPPQGAQQLPTYGAQPPSWSHQTPPGENQPPPYGSTRPPSGGPQVSGFAEQASHAASIQASSVGAWFARQPGWLKALLVVVFFPLVVGYGVWVMWRDQRFWPPVRIGLSIAFGIYMLFTLLVTAALLTPRATPAGVAVAAAPTASLSMPMAEPPASTAPATPTPTPTSTPTPTPPETLVASTITTQLGNSNRGVTRVREVSYENQTLRVVWAINNATTPTALIDGAKTDTRTILDAVRASGLPVQAVQLKGEYALPIATGRTSEVEVVNAVYPADKVARVSAELPISEIWNLTEGVVLHQSFKPAPPPAPQPAPAAPAAPAPAPKPATTTTTQSVPKFVNVPKTTTTTKVIVRTTTKEPEPEDEPEEEESSDSDSDLDPHFGTCREALAHGYGHYVKGKDPEYNWYRDADSDGIVCE